MFCGANRWFVQWIEVVSEMGVCRGWEKKAVGARGGVGFGVPGSREGTQHLQRFAASK